MLKRYSNLKKILQKSQVLQKKIKVNILFELGNIVQTY